LETLTIMKKTLIITAIVVCIWLVGCSSNSSELTNNNYKSVIDSTVSNVTMFRILPVELYNSSGVYLLTIDSAEYVLIRTSEGVAITPKQRK
jgi:uncharacterized protein YcfL